MADTTAEAELPLEVQIEPEKKPETAADEASKRLQAQLKAAEDTAEAEKRRFESERQARIAAEADVKRHQTDAQGYEQTIVSNALEAFTRQRDAAKRDLQRALENGEFDKASEAQSQLAECAAQIVNLQAAKDNFAQQRPAAEGRVDQPRIEQTNQRAADPFEQYVSQLSPKSQAWVRQHPECVTVRSKNMRMLAAHAEAVEELRLPPESPEYFRHVESRLGYRQAAQDDDDTIEVAPQRAAPQRPAMSAPVSREAPNSLPRNARSVKLTPAQQEAAKISGMSNEQYASQLLDLDRERPNWRAAH